MLVIGGTFEIDPDRRDEFVHAAIIVMAATRRESGCQQYTFGADLEDGGIIHVFERWTSQEDLAAHLQSEHVTLFRDVTAGLIRSRSLTKYGIDSEGPL